MNDKTENFKTILKKKLDDIYFENSDENGKECSVHGFCGPLSTLIKMENRHHVFYCEDGRVILRYNNIPYIKKPQLNLIDITIILLWVIILFVLIYVYKYFHNLS